MFSAAKYAFAKKQGASDGIAFLYAKDKIKLAGGGESGKEYLLLSPGNDRLLLSGYGKNSRLLIKSE